MAKVFMYSFKILDEFTLRIPDNCTFLKFEQQGENYCLWVLIDEIQEVVDKSFRIYGTGHFIDVDKYELAYIDTCLTSKGLIWHLFEQLK